MFVDAECPRCDYWIPGVALPAREDVALECPRCGERFTIPWESVIFECFAAQGYEPVTGRPVPPARHDGAVFVVSTA